MSRDQFANLLRNPVLSASLIVMLAAGAAGIFTVSTSTASPEINRAAKSDRAMMERDLSSLIFDARPVAGSRHQLVNDSEALNSSRRRTMTEQILPKRGPQEEQRPLKGCESGLSPDIQPGLSIAPSRCITQRETTAKFASLR